MNGNKFSDEVKQQVVNAYLNGVPSNELSKKFGVSRSSIMKWVHKYEQTVEQSTEKTVSIDVVYSLQQRIAKLDNENKFQARMIEYLIKQLADKIQ